MNSSEFEQGRPFTGEVDWSSQLPEFSARDRDVLRFMGYETMFLTGRYFNDLITEEDIPKIAEEYQFLDFNFANIRTMQSEVAIQRSLFLPGSESLTNEAADKMVQEHMHNLQEKKGLKDVTIRIGNIADYAALFNWSVEQQIELQSSSDYIATSTTNTVNGGRRCLGILFKGFRYEMSGQISGPKFQVKTMPLYNPAYGARIAPLIVPA